MRRPKRCSTFGPAPSTSRSGGIPTTTRHQRSRSTRRAGSSSASSGGDGAAATAAGNTLTLITVTFAPVGDDTTRMTFRQEDFADFEDRHAHGRGWIQFLESFARFLGARENHA